MANNYHQLKTGNVHSPGIELAEVFFCHWLVTNIESLLAANKNDRKMCNCAGAGLSSKPDTNQKLAPNVDKFSFSSLRDLFFGQAKRIKRDDVYAMVLAAQTIPAVVSVLTNHIISVCEDTDRGGLFLQTLV